MTDQFLEPDDLRDQSSGGLESYLALGRATRLNLLTKIISRCERVGDCLLWQGPTSGNGRGGGYGRMNHEGKTASVHRTVYAICYGPIPPKKQIDHSCNNRLCCNPLHLDRMTHKKNQKLRDERLK